MQDPGSIASLVLEPGAGPLVSHSRVLSQELLQPWARLAMQVVRHLIPLARAGIV